MIKDLVPESMRPTARRVQRGLAEGVKTVKGIATSLPGGPTLTDASLADPYVLTVLASAREPLSGLTAQVTWSGRQLDLGLDELLRYHQDGRHHILAKLTLPEPAAAGTTVKLQCDQGDVATLAATIRRTEDKSYPLIDRLVLTKSRGMLLIEDGTPRQVLSPTLQSLEWSDQAGGLVITADVPVSGARLHDRVEQSNLELSVSGQQVIIPAQTLVDVCPPETEDPRLLTIRVTTAELGESGLTSPNQWISVPRNYETFAPFAVPGPQGVVVVRPYWMLGGSLALKVRIK